MNFEKLENTIKDRISPTLIAAIPTVEVEVEPEYEGENDPVRANPRVTIFLDQSEFDKTSSTNYIAQEETVKVFLLVRARKLRGDGGVYHILELIRKTLVGFLPTNFSKIWLVRIAYEKHERGLWSYVVVIGMKGQIVEEHEENYPTFKTLNAYMHDNEFN